MQRIGDCQRFLGFAQLYRLCPHWLLFEQFLGALHVGLFREHAAAIEIFMPFCHAITIHAHRAVGGLLRIRMHRLVREPQ